MGYETIWKSSKAKGPRKKIVKGKLIHLSNPISFKAALILSSFELGTISSGICKNIRVYQIDSAIVIMIGICTFNIMLTFSFHQKALKRDFTSKFVV